MRDRQDGADLDLDLDIEQNSNLSNKSLTNKVKSISRLATSNRSSPQTVTTNNPNELQTITFPMEKKEFDYDFVRKFVYKCKAKLICYLRLIQF